MSKLTAVTEFASELDSCLREIGSVEWCSMRRATVVFHGSMVSVSVTIRRGKKVYEDNKEYTVKTNGISLSEAVCNMEQDHPETLDVFCAIDYD